MNIFVISDTHHNIEKAVEVYKKLKDIDLVIHAGDYIDDADDFSARTGAKVVSVKGNCDRSFDEKDCVILETEAGDILVSHGHMQNVGFSQQAIYYLAAENDCIAAIYGHTHIPVNTQWDGIHLINPGSLSKPRDNSSGSFALIQTSEDALKCDIHYYDDFMADKVTKSKVKGGHLRSLLNYSDRF